MKKQTCSALPVVIALGLMFGGRASAQEEQVKPYVMLLFDTSGSMIWDVCHSDYDCIDGDNSTECPGNQISCSHCNTYGCGNGIADDSRLYKVKNGAYNVVSAFGEAIFGLSRFRQTPASFTCNASANGRAGGWVGASGAWVLKSGNWYYYACYNPATLSDHPMGQGTNQADVLVGISDNNQMQIINWLNNCQDWSNSSGTTPLVCGPPYAPSSGCNLCTDCGGGCDSEIRGSGNTPIAGSLYDLRVSYFPTVFAADAQKLSCRPYKLILLTDGENNCTGNPVTEAGNLFNNAAKSIPVHVIGFGTAALKPNLDAIAAAGGTTQAIIVDNEVSLALAMANIVSESLLKEVCNNADDDCDDLCDESWPEVAVTGAPCTNQHAAQTCTAGLGICLNTGTYVCKADGSGSECTVSPGPPNPGGEICYNGLDDDCDGAIDEGCLPCGAQPEICDGKDNDCDTLIDEGYVPVACGSSIGECAQGMSACQGGKVVCLGAVPASTELCDNKDNNCDTIVDNFSETCYPAGWGNGCVQATGVCQGVCQIGSRLCTNGSWGACFGAQGPTAEACNGLDDNCDGQIDEGVTNTCTNYATCATYTTCSACLAKPVEVCDGNDNDCNGTIDDNPLLAGTPCGAAVGECTKGTWACENGGLVCKGGVQPTPEICDNKDNDCDGAIDESIAGLGAACGSSVGECTQGTTKCIGGKVVCSGEVGPGTEVCDGKDNDCNGTVDDNLASVVCGSDVGECTQGTTQCASGKVTCSGAVGPTPEICDNKDNNCNGLADDYPTDEGTLCGSTVGECTQGTNKCVGGKLVCVGGNGPKTEICDGKDNDCNGTVDDNIVGAGAACGTEVGECTKGALACALGSGGWATQCAGAVGPKSEICDGKDNDCDGETDEDYPEKGKSCGTNVGECKAGTYVCENGKLSCQGAVGSTPEVCDNKDNDCNGKIDDNVPGEGDPCGVSVGECKAGKKKCVGGKFICVGEVGPTKEICDNKDNDCDGKVDDMAECPGGSACVEGSCLLPCTPGEFTCPGGTKCVNGYCVPNKCTGVVCKATEFCVEGKCVERCSGVVCSAHEKCAPTTGQCVDDSCVTKGCPEGKTCISYECIDNPCAKDTCPEGQMCINGKCYDTCVNVTCPTGQVCVQGQCTTDPCVGFDCGSNFICKVVDGEGKCVPDPCRVVTCNPGEVCHDGSCIADPCAATACPEGFECEVNHAGQPDCTVMAGHAIATTTQMLATGAGGCSCETGRAGLGSAPVLAPLPGAPGYGIGALLGLLGLLGLRSRREGGQR